MAGTTRSKLVEPLKGIWFLLNIGLWYRRVRFVWLWVSCAPIFCFGASGERLSSACASEHPVLDLRGSRVAPPPPPGDGHARGPRPPRFPRRVLGCRPLRTERYPASFGRRAVGGWITTLDPLCLRDLGGGGSGGGSRSRRRSRGRVWGGGGGEWAWRSRRMRLTENSVTFFLALFCH